MLSYLLRLADDNLVLAQRLSALIARMPELEEDIAIANIGLDHLGQARNFYSYASQFDALGRDEDQFAMLRSEREFVNAVLVEQPDVDFAHTVVRQFFVDAYQVPLYEVLAASTDETLAGMAAKALKEARYHLEYSSGWVIRLGDGTSESHERCQTAVDTLWPFTADLFAGETSDAELIAQGVAADPAVLRPQFDRTISAVLAEAQLRCPSDPYQRLGGRTGFHTEHLGHLLPEMQSVYRAHPGATW
ncbi:MAG: phenylacetate-CoA oxygenase subunit PaaC [Actinomycetota bacterium]|nr:phenylacetate-CoA oxygenase subunit PaaC [Actinomycetota bacterium]